VEDVRREEELLQSRLDELKKRLDGLDVLALRVPGSPVEKILEASAEHGAELIIIGSHGHGALYHLLVGSVTDGVLKSAACPVVVVPGARGAAGAESRSA
jgi:nucleotide-binding universal stress UspA family protein